MKDNRRAWIVGLLALAMIASTPGRAADTLVVADVRGMPLQPGQTIDTAHPLKLEAGQRVTLIAENGAVIKLTGPFDGVPDPAGERLGSVADSLLKLASLTAEGTSTLGTVRAPETAPPQPWLVAVGSSGLRCLPEGQPVVFWRPPADDEQTAEISPSDRAWQAQAKWPARADKLVMPSSFPAQDDQTYVIAVGSTSSRVTLHIIPHVVASDVMRSAWMLEKRCVTQARVLLDSLK